jgi:hypothetical protein
MAAQVPDIMDGCVCVFTLLKMFKLPFYIYFFIHMKSETLYNKSSKIIRGNKIKMAKTELEELTK